MGFKGLLGRNQKDSGFNPESFDFCGRWDLNPHERNAHKILSLARLPVPTLPLDLRHKLYPTPCVPQSQEQISENIDTY